MPSTIIALATPPGVSALAVIRLSGPESFSLTSQLVSKLSPWLAHRSYYRSLKFQGELLDEVMITSYRAPASFTGEDTVEICCHGNPLIIQRIITAFLTLGAQPSLPGEFTQRAFLNGKLDLTQAESVIDVIEASTPEALRGAQAILEGALGLRMQDLRVRLIDLLAHLEAYIDFPDEDIKPETGHQFIQSVQLVLGQVNELIASAPLGKILREGVATVIVGSPNVGKSSLFNALVRKDQAIVSPIPGTTRDLIETGCNVAGFYLRLIDTAGQRETIDTIEAEGVKRAQHALARADLILYLVDAAQAQSQDPFPAPLPEAHQHLISIAHKADLGVHPDHRDKLAVSSLSREGLALLETTIGNRLRGGRDLQKQGWLAVNARQEAALNRAREALLQGKTALENVEPPELASSHLREALQAIGEVVGVATNEDILDSLFKKFCIGK